MFCAYNTFLNLDTEDAQRRCLAGCADLLAPDGAVVIEAYVPAPPEDVPRTSLDVAKVTTDAVVLTATEHDPIAQVVTGQHVELRDGTVRLRPWRVRYLTPEQLDALAAEAGLRAGGPLERLAGHPVRRRQRHPRVRLPPGVPGLALRGGAPAGGPSPSPHPPVSQLRLNPLTGRWVTIAAEPGVAAR